MQRLHVAPAQYADFIAWLEEKTLVRSRRW
jgi:hypothetical protein